MSGSFFDSNILIYFVSADQTKSARAKDLIQAGGVISVQNLNEFANVARRKLGRSWPDIVKSLLALRTALTVAPVTVEMHETGLAVAERYGTSLYDSMVIAAALLAKCDRLWSEDMQNGLVVDGRLRIVNPFV